jgi:uncharacterized protein
MMLDLRTMSDFPAHLALNEDALRLDISIDGVSLLGKALAECDIVKGDHIYYCTGQAFCDAEIVCSRCLEPYRDRLSGEIEFSIQEVADGRQVKPEEIPENEIVIPANSPEVDISAPVREALLLALPMKPLCGEDCLGICPSCGINLNKQNCECKSEKTDSRWDGLRNLFNK